MLLLLNPPSGKTRHQSLKKFGRQPARLAACEKRRHWIGYAGSIVEQLRDDLGVKIMEELREGAISTQKAIFKGRGINTLTSIYDYVIN